MYLALKKDESNSVKRTSSLSDPASPTSTVPNIVIEGRDNKSKLNKKSSHPPPDIPHNPNAFKFKI